MRFGNLGAGRRKKNKGKLAGKWGLRKPETAGYGKKC